MNQFLEMDVFFVITTVVVVLIGIALVFIFARIWHILGYFEKITRDVSEESTLLRDDIAEFRQKVRYDGFKMRYVPVFIRTLIRRMKTKKDSAK